ncbi:PRTRC system protein C [Desulfovibrio oxyclinae]|uniref:PRTRC system protein C n=1 Tax=Desulfovibrio oxyclinae TaxID=63560 RepID=UPI00035D00E7|nr:PRTRC system protein C [Desulfovibrio oxyclinae]
MTVEVKSMPRVFKCKIGGEERTLPDPDANMFPEQVMRHYAATYPELTNAVASGPDVKQDEVVWTFAVNVGRKG